MQKSIFSLSDFIKNFPTPSKFREKEKQMAQSYTPDEKNMAIMPVCRSRSEVRHATSDPIPLTDWVLQNKSIAHFFS